MSDVVLDWRSWIIIGKKDYSNLNQFPCIRCDHEASDYCRAFGYEKLWDYFSW